MLPQLASALSKGFSAKQIIDLILKQFPQHSDKIKKAMAAGFGADQILKYIGRGKKLLNQFSEETKPTAGTEYEKTREKDIQRRENVNKGALAAGTLAVGSLAAPMAASALNRAIPNSLKSLIPALTEAPQEQTIQPLSQQPPSQQVATNISQQASIVQPEIKSINVSEIFSKYPGFEAKVNDLMKSGNDPEAISTYFKQFNASQTKKLEKETGKTIEELISEYISTKPTQEKKQLSKEEALAAFRDHQMVKHAEEAQKPAGMESQGAELDVSEEAPKVKSVGFDAAFKTMEGGAATNKLYEGIFDSLKKGKDTFAGVKDPLIEKAKPYFQKGLIKSPEDLKEFVNNPQKFKEIEIPKLEKGSSVASPQGVGQVQAIRNGKAIIDVDGKKHQVDENELIESPLPEKDLAELYEDLISGIEKTSGKQVSRNVEWAGYDPKTNELAYKPHGGDKLYAYDDIPEDDIKILTSLMTQRKSTGENFIGAWEAGTESPIGAAMYQLIKKLQAARGGKGNEYKNKWETIYDALEPAKLALKRKYEERKKKAKKSRPN